MKIVMYIDPTMPEYDQFERLLDEEAEKLINKIPDISLIDCKLAHSSRHYNPFCSFKLFCQKPGEAEIETRSFLVELHENDVNRSIEILRRSFAGLRGELV